MLLHRLLNHYTREGVLGLDVNKVNWCLSSHFERSEDAVIIKTGSLTSGMSMLYDSRSCYLYVESVIFWLIFESVNITRNVLVRAWKHLQICPKVYCWTSVLVVADQKNHLTIQIKFVWSISHYVWIKVWMILFVKQLCLFAKMKWLVSSAWSVLAFNKSCEKYHSFIFTKLWKSTLNSHRV